MREHGLNHPLFGGRAAIAAGGALAAIGTAWLVMIVCRQTLPRMDFRYIWLAGHLWSTGVDPYTPAFSAAGHLFFPDDPGMTPWFYPFHWYLPARAAALFDPDRAFRLWLLATLPLTLATALAGGRVARDCGVPLRIGAALLLLGYVLTTTLVSAAVRTGQPTVLAVAGLPVACWGVRHRRSWAIAIGAWLLLLKPQLGLPCVAALALLPGALAGVVMGGAAIALAALPALLTSHGLGAIGAFLANARGGHAVIDYNLPAEMSGLAHLIEPLADVRLTLFASLLLATALAAGCALWRRQARPDAAGNAMFLAVVPPLCVAAVVSVHPYDLTILLVALPFAPRASLRAQAILAIGFVILWRPENLARLGGGSAEAVATLATIGVIILCAGWATAWRDERVVFLRRQEP